MDRPANAPKPGQIESFDDGWNAAEIGLDRETVEICAHPTKKDWALLAWDIHHLVKQREAS